MNYELTISPDKVRVVFSNDPADHVDAVEVEADFDLEGTPVGFQAFNFKSPPLGETNRLDTSQFTATFVPEDNALAVWFRKEPRSSDQEILEAELGFSRNGLLVFVQYKYQRGAAASRHKDRQ